MAVNLSMSYNAVMFGADKLVITYKTTWCRKLENYKHIFQTSEKCSVRSVCT